MASGAAHGLTLAWEFSRLSRHGPKPGLWCDAAMSAIRGAGFALEAFDKIAFFDQIWFDDFDRDIAFDRKLARFVNSRHAAHPQERVDPVLSDSLSD